MASVDPEHCHALCLLATCIWHGSVQSTFHRIGAAYDPERPSIVGCTRRPVLWAATLWASAHVVPNGDLAHVIVFCMFASLGALGALMLDVRRRRDFGSAEWHRLSAHTSFVPLAALLTGKWLPSPYNLNFLRLIAAAGLYLGFLGTARGRHWRIATSATLTNSAAYGSNNLLSLGKTPWIISMRRNSSAFCM